MGKTQSYGGRGTAGIGCPVVSLSFVYRKIGGAGPIRLEMLPDNPCDLVWFFHRKEMTGVWNGDKYSLGNLLSDFFSNEREGRIGIFSTQNDCWTVHQTKL